MKRLRDELSSLGRLVAVRADVHSTRTVHKPSGRCVAAKVAGPASEGGTAGTGTGVRTGVSGAGGVCAFGRTGRTGVAGPACANL